MADRWDCVSGTMIPDDSGPYVSYHDYLSTACDRDEQLHAYLTWREEAERLKVELEAAQCCRPVTPTEPPERVKVLVRDMEHLDMAIAYRQRVTAPGLSEPVEEWLVETCSDNHNISPPKKWLPIPGGEDHAAVGIPGEARYDVCAGLRAAVGKAREEEARQ